MAYAILRDFGTPELVAEKLEAGALQATAMEPAFEIIAADMFKAEEALFNSQGRRGGGSWKPLLPDTVRKKGHSVIEIDTDGLRKSLTEPGGDNILNFTPTSVEFGTANPIAHFQQEGTVKMPARPIIKFYSRDYQAWSNILTRHLMEPFVV